MIKQQVAFTPEHVRDGSLGDEVVVALVPLVLVLPHVGSVVARVQRTYVVHHREQRVFVVDVCPVLQAIHEVVIVPTRRHVRRHV